MIWCFLKPNGLKHDLMRIIHVNSSLSLSTYIFFVKTIYT